jgi:hypothetical protein
MNRMRSMALPALLALSGLGLCGAKAAAQYVGGGTAYAPGYYSAPGPGYYGSGYYCVPRPAAGPYYEPVRRGTPDGPNDPHCRAGKPESEDS